MLLANFYTSSLTLYSHIIVLHFFIAGFSMYLFMHNQTKKPLVAILAGIGFMFSGPLIAWLSWGTIPGIISTTPLLLYFIDKYFTKNELKWLVPATLTHYWMASSGHLQFYFFALCLTSAYVLFKYFSTKKKKRPKTVPLFATALIQISIALIFIIPFFQSIQSAHRSHITDINTLQPKNLAQLFAPDVWGSHTAFTGPLNYVETFSYPGVILLALAAVSLLIFFINKTFHTKEEKFWFFILGTVLAYTLFPQPTEWISNIIPFFKSFPPFRAVFILTTTIIVLAGLFAKRIHIKNAKLTALYFTCAILLTLVQGWQLFTQYTPQQSKEPLQNPPPHITFLQNQDSPLIYSELHPLNMYALYGISSLFGYDTTYSEAYYQDISQNTDSIISHRNILNAEISDQAYLQELGVTHIVTNKVSPLFNNLPIAYEDANVRIFQLKK
jgi:hypothetical protein